MWLSLVVRQSNRGYGSALRGYVMYYSKVTSKASGRDDARDPDLSVYGLECKTNAAMHAKLYHLQATRRIHFALPVSASTFCRSMASPDVRGDRNSGLR